VLPELCDSGYVFTGAAEARALATPAANSPTLRQWQALSMRHATTIAGGFCEAVLVAPCDLAQARDKKISDHNDALADRRPPLYRAVAE
jgi:predicted amidohydrolase